MRTEGVRLSIPKGSPQTQGGLWLVRFRVLAVRALCGEVAAVSLHHHPAQCERRGWGSLRWSLLTICLTRAGIGPWRGSWAGRSRSPLGGQAGRPAAGKGPLCRLCVGLPPRVVSPVRVGQSGAGRPGGGVGRASGDPFAVLPPAPSVRCEVRAVVPAAGPAWRRGGAAACCGRVAGIARAGQ